MAVAEPGYYYPGYYHQQYWPSARLPGFESTCYGCRLGKRSADADAEPYYGYYGYGLRPYGIYGYGAGVAGHPTGTSYTQRSPQVKSLDFLAYIT